MKAKSMVERLELVIGLDGAPVRAISIIERELISHFGVPPIRAGEQAENMLGSVIRVICERSIYQESTGLSPVLTVLGNDSDVISGYFHVLGQDSELIAAAKRRRTYCDVLLEKIRSLSFSEFELLGKRVIEELGVADAAVTPHANDQGIDFFGRFSLGRFSILPRPFLTLAHEVNLIMIGQAKHYPNKALGPDTVRELIGAMSLAKSRSFSNVNIDLFESLEMRPFSPVVALLFATGTATHGAIQLASSAGIVLKSGKQLAVFLSDRGVGINKRCGDYRFEDTEFDRWLRGR